MNSEEYKKVTQTADTFFERYHQAVSVVIPHYNAHNLLARCIASLESQSYPSELVEVIVSDDGSDHFPCTSELVNDSSLDVKIIKQERFGFRASSARNRAIEIASGEVIICLDADMIPVGNFIESHMRYFHVSKQVATIGPRKFIDVSHVPREQVVSLRESFRLCPDVASVSNHGYPLDGRLPYLENFHHESKPYWFFYSCNVAFRRHTALEVGLFDEDFDGQWGYEDIDFGYRLFKAGCLMVYVPQALAFHQENTVTSRSKRSDDGEVNFKKLLTKWPELEDEEPSTIPDDL